MSASAVAVPQGSPWSAVRARLGARGREIAEARFDEKTALVRYRALLGEVAARGASAQLAAR